MDCADVIAVAIFDSLDLFDSTPPVGPLLRVEDEVPHFLLRRFESPDGYEFVISHLHVESFAD